MQHGRANFIVACAVACGIHSAWGVHRDQASPFSGQRRGHRKRGAQPGGPRPACEAKQKLLRHGHKGKLVEKTLHWEEDGLPPVERQYSVYVPSGYNPSLPSGLVLIFHGWGDPDYEEKVDHWGKWPGGYHGHYGYGKAAESHNLIAVYPKGLSDCANGAECADPDAGPLSSWNCAGTTKSEGHSNTSVCELALQPFNYCYSSCRAKKGGCHRCDWTTCYDDVGFTRRLLEVMEEDYCIDTSQVFATGCSNGGMFTHELAQRMPDKFAAIASNCAGKPHQGFEKMPDSGTPISMLLISGSHDQTIRGVKESKGKKWWDGFKYASNEEVIASYKAYNKCKNNKTRSYLPKTGDQMISLRSRPGVGLRQPFEHGGMDSDSEVIDLVSQGVRDRSFGLDEDTEVQRVTCQEAGFDCADSVNVVSCIWPGGHDIRQGDPNFIMQYFKEHSRSGPPLGASP